MFLQNTAKINEDNYLKYEKVKYFKEKTVTAQYTAPEG